MCGLPLGSVDVRTPTVMANLLGDSWPALRDVHNSAAAGREPDWHAILAAPRVKLHLYGETDPRPGKKMGHFTVSDTDIETAIVRAKELSRTL